MGVVWPGEPDAVPAGKLKTIERLLPAKPLAPEIIDFIVFVAAYTMFPLGAALRLVMRSGDALDPPSGATAYAPTGAAPQRMTEARAAALAALGAGDTPLTAREIAERAGASDAVIRGLVKAGALAPVLIDPDPPFDRPDPDRPHLALSGDQRAAADALVAATMSAGTTLLDGVTGSGKTEVYLEAAAAVLAALSAMRAVELATSTHQRLANAAHPTVATRLFSRTRVRTILSTMLVLIVTCASGQEAYRVSLAGQDAAEAKKRALANERFNLRLGPVSMRFQAGLATEVTDNVRNASTDEQAHLSFRPIVSTVAIWPVTPQNTLSFSMGLGYAKYLHATEYDGLFVAPGSDLSLDLDVQDMVINFHDRFSFSQDVTGDPTVSGIGGLDRFENTSGAGVTWDLNKMLVTAGYDYAVYVPTEDLYANQNRGSHLFNASSALVINPTTLAGLQAFGGLTDYDESLYSDNQHVGVGGFVNAQLSE